MYIRFRKEDMNSAYFKTIIILIGIAYFLSPVRTAFVHYCNHFGREKKGRRKNFFHLSESFAASAQFLVNQQSPENVSTVVPYSCSA